MRALESARNFFAELHRRNPVLSWMGWANVALLAAALAAAPFDSRTVTGINPWIKPMKFAASVAIFLFTMGWLLEHVKRYRRTVRVVAWGVAVVFAVEQACIFMQAARGTISHFNVRSAFDAAVFSMMGLMIVVNTVAVAYVAQRFWRGGAGVPAPYLWGVRLGLLIFLLASLEGFVMIGLSSHSVGVADGGPGLPLINWSTRGGDLRVAHFVGLHALQVLPLLGYVFSTQFVAARLRRPALWVCALGALYGGASALLFVQALSGLPLFSF